MERLTKKISKTIQDKYSLGSYLIYDFANADDTNKLLNKLGQIEDFMEEYSLNLDHLKQIIKWFSDLNGEDFKQMTFICQDRAKIYQSNEKVKQENQKLKDRWNMLKAWITNQKQLMGNNLCFMKETLLQKIEELEKESQDER